MEDTGINKDLFENEFTEYIDQNEEMFLEKDLRINENEDRNMIKSFENISPSKVQEGLHNE